MTRKEGRPVEGGRPNKGREWTRPERGGENHGAQTTWRGRKMVILHPEPAPGYTPPLGATLLGRVVLLRRATAPGSRWLQCGAQSWVIPKPGRPGPAARGEGRGPSPRGAQSHRGPQRPGGQRHLGPGRRAVPRGRGRHSSRAPSTTTPSPRPPLTTHPKTGHPGAGSAAPRPGPLRLSLGRASPLPPHPSPQPDSPRE